MSHVVVREKEKVEKWIGTAATIISEKGFSTLVQVKGSESEWANPQYTTLADFTSNMF